MAINVKKQKDNVEEKLCYGCASHICLFNINPH